MMVDYSDQIRITKVKRTLISKHFVEYRDEDVEVGRPYKSQLALEASVLEIDQSQIG